MKLWDSTTVGMLNPVSNYAHELGHAWGLYHEHQNPNFWKGVDFAEDGEVFGPGNNNWRCSNLKDYSTYVTGLVVQDPLGQTTINRARLCSNYAWASQRGFSAADYLPYPSQMGISQPGKSSGDVDWTSLMICKVSNFLVFSLLSSNSPQPRFSPTLQTYTMLTEETK